MVQTPNSTEGILPSMYEFALLQRSQIDLQTVSPKELLAINENARRQLEIYLTRLRVSEEEILRRNEIGESMENTDYIYEVVPDPHSPSETGVRVSWKPGRVEKVLGTFNNLDGTSIGF